MRPSRSGELTNPDAEHLLGGVEPTGGSCARWLRDLITDAEPGLEERVRPGWVALTYHHPQAGYVVGVFPRPGHAQLVIEHGAAMTGFDDVFDGGGRQIRKVVVASVPDPRQERLKDLVAASIAAGIERTL